MLLHTLLSAGLLHVTPPPPGPLRPSLFALDPPADAELSIAFPAVLSLGLTCPSRASFRRCGPRVGWFFFLLCLARRLALAHLQPPWPLPGPLVGGPGPSPVSQSASASPPVQSPVVKSLKSPLARALDLSPSGGSASSSSSPPGHYKYRPGASPGRHPGDRHSTSTSSQAKSPHATSSLSLYQSVDRLLSLPSS